MSSIFLEINWKCDYLSWPQNYHLYLLLQSNWNAAMEHDSILGRHQKKKSNFCGFLST